ncbi:MAG: alpha/beta fold hydrolase [Candidatus Rokubacteria bacterium]|nr:alpha/beta fold hydrolase [Candidatus Rokubacteria bacterium]
MITEGTITLRTADGVSLEARLGLAGAPTAGLVVCHPHPLYGGDMDNPVVVRVAEVGAGLGWATLRFNFRGVGGSGGTHGGGTDEQADVAAALAHLRSRVAGGSVVLAGYSFGATVASAVALEADGLAGLVLIAPPLAFPGFEPAPLERFEAPLLLVSGNADEYCPRESLERLGAGLARATLRVIDGANHFFLGRLFPLGEVVAEWVRGLQAREAPGRRGAG